MRPTLVHVVDRDDPRAGALRHAARAHGAAWRVRTLDYETALDALDGVIEAPTFGAPDVVKIDTPGRSARIHRRLLARVAGAESATETTWRTGALRATPQWYAAAMHAIRGIHALAAPAHALVDPDDVARWFDKAACAAWLRTLGVPVPRALGTPTSYDELRSAMTAASCRRAFIKLRHGSGAAGIVALCVHPRGAVEGWTTVELDARVPPHAFSTRRVRHLTGEAACRAVIDAIAPFGLHAEAWVPKAGLEGGRFDLRVIVIDGAPAHGVIRVSRHPMTNLHLGGTRLPLDRLTATWPAGARDAVHETCRTIAAAAPRSFQLALDIALAPSLRAHAVLEVNAFGDFLRDVMHDGRCPYGAQFAALDQRRLVAC